MYIVSNIFKGEILTGLLNSFMDIDFYILYWFMYHISIFNRSDLYVAEICFKS